MADDVVKRVQVIIGADTYDLERGSERSSEALDDLRRSANRTSGSLNDMARTGRRYARTMAYVGAAITGAAYAAYNLASSTAKTGDAIAKASRQAGLSADYFQEMTFAIGQVTNATQEELTNAFTILNRKLGEAKDGSKSAIEAFEALGFSQEEIANGAVTSEVAIDALVKKLGEMKDPAAAAALATDLFGRAGGKLGAQLAGSGSEVASLRDRAKELGLVLSGETLAASEKFADKTDEMSRAFEALRLKVGAELLPLFVNQVIPFIVDDFIPAISSMVDSIKSVVVSFQNLPAPVLQALSLIGEALGGNGPIQVPMNTLSGLLFNFFGDTGPIGLGILAANTFALAWQEFGDSFRNTVGGAIDWVSVKFDELMAKIQSVIEWLKAAKTSISEALDFGIQGSMNTPGGYTGMGNAADEFGGGMFGGGGGGGVGGAMGGQALGSAIINGVVLGSATSIEENRERLIELFNQIPQIARDALQIQSPSKVFEAIGQFLGIGLADGIASTQKMVGDAVGVLADTAVFKTQDMTNSVLGSLGTLFQGSKKFAIAQALINAWQGASEALKLPFPKNLAAFASVLSTGINAVKNIKATSPGSGGGGGSAGVRGGRGASADTTAAAAPAAPQVTNFEFTLSNDPGGFGERFARQFVEQLNATQRNGGQIRGVIR